MKVSVLGGGGFIGSHVVARLVAEGHDVTAVDVEWQPWREDLLIDAWKMDADLTDPRAAREAVAGADWVFHFAADNGGVGYLQLEDADLNAALANGEMTTNVFRAVAFEETPRTFFASSACAYPVEMQGDPLHTPLLREEWIGRGTPEALYGAEKLHGLRLAAKVPGVRVGIQHAIYGPGMEWEGRRVKFPAAVVRKALGARETGRLDVWGDGRQQRSYLYIDDAVEQILRVMAADHYWGPVNIGATGAISCRRVAEMCLQLVGATDAQIVCSLDRPTGVQARDCDNAEFYRRYGAAPDRSYSEGFTKLIDWVEAYR